MKKIYIINEKGHSQSVKEGQKIIVSSPLPTDFSKKRKSPFKEERVAYVYHILTPDKIIVNMLTSKDKFYKNQFIKRTNADSNQIGIREFYFVVIDSSLILKAKKDILDQNEMKQFEKIVHTYSLAKQKLLENSKQDQNLLINKKAEEELEM